MGRPDTIKNFLDPLAVLHADKCRTTLHSPCNKISRWPATHPSAPKIRKTRSFKVGTIGVVVVLMYEIPKHYVDI